MTTAESDAAAIVEALGEIMADPQAAHIRDTLELGDLVAPDVAAYEHLADYERQAAELGFPEIR